MRDASSDGGRAAASDPRRAVRAERRGGGGVLLVRSAVRDGTAGADLLPGPGGGVEGGGARLAAGKLCDRATFLRRPGAGRAWHGMAGVVWHGRRDMGGDGNAHS